jgi:predicted phage terminase large subunit-like protein
MAAISKDQVEEFLHLTRRSLVATGKALYPDLMGLKASKLHYELSTALVEGTSSMVIAYPREFGKSTYAWELLSSWNVLHRRYRYIMYIGATTTIAKRMLSTNVIPNIKQHPLLRSQIKITKDTQEEFHYEINGEKYFMACFGAGQQLRGTRFQSFRPDLVVMDDIETTEATKSEDQRRKLKDWMWADVIPLGKTARFFFVGTMLHSDCLLANFMENPPEDVHTGKKWETRRYGVLDEDGVSVWPEKYSDEWIDAKRKEYIKQGALDRFNTEYMNIPVARADRMFLPEQITYYAPDQGKAAMSGGMDIIITVDPGIHNENHRDPTVIMVTGMDKNGNVWILDMLRERLVHHKILEEIVAAFRKWRPRMTFIESVQSAFWLFQDLTTGTHMTRDIIPCEKIEGSQVAMGKNVRIQGLESLFFRKQIYVPAEAQWIDEMINEMVTFPKGKNDDVLDALSYAKLNHVQPGGLSYNFGGLLDGNLTSSTVF